MKKINIEELFNNNFDCYTIEVINWKQFEVPALTKDKFKELCINLSKQLLELAAENATFLEDGCPIKSSRYIVESGNYSEIEIDVDKQSILDTIKQIE